MHLIRCCNRQIKLSLVLSVTKRGDIRNQEDCSGLGITLPSE